MFELMNIWVKGNDLADRAIKKRELNEFQRGILVRYCSFYRRLAILDKRRFEHRVKRFMEEHNYVGREGVVITQKMKLLIASTAVMLTFGMRRYLFSEFDNIIIYPKDYFSHVTKMQHKGETNPKYRTIVFSWNDFLEGLKVEYDNLNLGLHELTHALHFTCLRRRNFTSRYFINKFGELLEILKNRSLQRRVVESGYIRPYGFRNKYEFLSVLVEHFFETPNEFKQKLPELYKIASQMLNLDPAAFDKKPALFKSIVLGSA